MNFSKKKANNAALAKVKANKAINNQLNNEIAEFERLGFPVTNKNAFRAFRRAEIASGRRNSYTPAQAKAAANNALKKSAAGAALGAAIGAAAPVVALAAGGTAAGGVAGQGQRIAGQQGARILNKMRKLKNVQNLLVRAETQTISFADMTRAVNMVAGPYKNRVAAALGGHVQGIGSLLSEMTAASAIL